MASVTYKQLPWGLGLGVCPVEASAKLPGTPCLAMTHPAEGEDSTLQSPQGRARSCPGHRTRGVVTGICPCSGEGRLEEQLSLVAGGCPCWVSAIVLIS